MVMPQCSKSRGWGVQRLHFVECGSGDTAMTDQNFNRLLGSSPLTTVAMVIYFGVGYGLIKKSGPTLTLDFEF